MSDFIESERVRLTQARTDLVEKRHVLQTQIAEVDRDLHGVDREFEAVKAYELAKQGKLNLNGGQVRRSPVQAASGGRRSRDGSRRNSLLEMIGNAPNGMARGELIYASGVKGDKNAEMSISNALTALTKAGQVIRHEGKYFTSNIATSAPVEVTANPVDMPTTNTTDQPVEAAA